MAELYISDRFLSDAKRLKSQIERMDRAWHCVRNDDKGEKGDRMRRVLKIQNEKRARLSIIMEVILR